MKRGATLLLLALALPSAARAEASGKKRRPLPYEYGTVVIKNHSEAAGLAPVVFEHWLHRAKYTCRLCHVDIGFAMKAGATDIKAADNMRGFYCGACHRKSATGVKAVFEACAQATPHEQRPALLARRLGARRGGQGERKQQKYGQSLHRISGEPRGQRPSYHRPLNGRGRVRPLDAGQGLSCGGG